MDQTLTQSNPDAVNDAFSRQSHHYDADDRSNVLLQHMREQVYKVIDKFLPPQSNILELNAGTGIDALRLISRGHRVLATDLSDGMIQQLHEKARHVKGLRVEQLSFDKLDELSTTEKFDLVFSNFGGLNCISDLSKVTRHLSSLLKPDGYVIWVVMPRVCPWEILQLLKLNSKALRRFKHAGTQTHLEGQYFTTYYHPLKTIKSSFNRNFKFISSESLAVLSPQPHQWWLPKKYPKTYSILSAADRLVRNSFPFNRWGDHIIVTFQYKP